MSEEQMVERVHQLTAQIDHMLDKSRLKDSIIATLVLQIRAILRYQIKTSIKG